jgi:hypothetical protein
MKDIETINGNYCIQLLIECINNSSNTYQEEWSKLKWKNGIDLESMDYDNAIKIAKILGLDKNSVETVISTLNNKYYNKYNKNISYSVKITFEAIKYKISKHNLMKGGSSEIINYMYTLLNEIKELLNNKGKEIDINDLFMIDTIITNKKLIDEKCHLIINVIDRFKDLLEDDKILIPDEMIKLRLVNIKELLETVK